MTATTVSSVAPNNQFRPAEYSVVPIALDAIYFESNVFDDSNFLLLNNVHSLVNLRSINDQYINLQPNSSSAFINANIERKIEFHGLIMKNFTNYYYWSWISYGRFFQFDNCSFTESTLGGLWYFLPIAIIVPEYNLTGNMTNSIIKDITFYHLNDKPVYLIYFLPYSRGKGHRN
jgi:hypothetical protein